MYITIFPTDTSRLKDFAADRLNYHEELETRTLIGEEVIKVKGMGLTKSLELLIFALNAMKGTK